MKPYGKKPEKNRLATHPSDCCSICSNDEWKIIKSRARQTPEEELDEFFDDIIYEDFQGMVTVESYADLFIANYHPLDIEEVGYTPEHAMDKVFWTFLKNFDSLKTK